MAEKTPKQIQNDVIKRSEAQRKEAERKRKKRIKRTKGPISPPSPKSPPKPRGRGGTRKGAGRKQRKGGKPGSHQVAARVRGKQKIKPITRNVNFPPVNIPITPTFVNVARVGQPRPILQRGQLEKKDYDLNRVSSSWIGLLGYTLNTKTVAMILLNGYTYRISDVPFWKWEEWFFAMSKGTYFNEEIRGNFTIRRLY